MTRIVEQRYADVGRFAAGLPSEAVFIAGLHAGSIRYYTGRLTLYSERLHFRALDKAVDALTAMGRRPYFVVEEGEEARFRWRFDSSSDLGKLDWPPAAATRRGVLVRIYDPADRKHYVDGQPIVTYDVQLAGPPIVSRKTIP